MDLTRREILGTLAGASLAAMSGCGTPPPPFPKGEIIGASDSFGHQLRDGLLPKPAADAWTDIPLVIVGGGVAGLSAAWHLKKSGFNDFVLLELEQRAGGTSCSGSSPVSAYPWGGHYLPVPMKKNTQLIRLLDEMKILESIGADGTPIVAEQFLVRDPDERIFFNGRWYEGLFPSEGATSEDLRQFEVFKKEIDQWANWRDGQGRRAFSVPVATCSDDPHATALDKISMRQWLDSKGFNSKRLNWYVEYATLDDHGTTLEQTSAWAGLFYFAARQEKSGVEHQQFITWPEGNGRLIAHLHEKVKAHVRLGVATTDIASTPEGLRVTAYDRSLNKALGFRAKHVIFAAPQFLAQRVIAEYRNAPPPHIKHFQYGAWFVANLFIKERPKLNENDMSLCWDNVIYDSKSVGYIVATHQSCIDYGKTVLTYYYPFIEENPRDARTRLLAGDWAHWAEFTLADLSTAHPDIRSIIERIDIMRWGHAMIQPRAGFIWSDARMQAAKPFGAIHFAHSDLSGMAFFEEAFHHGLRAADEVLLQARA